MTGFVISIPAHIDDVKYPTLFFYYQTINQIKIKVCMSVSLHACALNWMRYESLWDMRWGELHEQHYLMARGAHERYLTICASDNHSCENTNDTAYDYLLLWLDSSSFNKHAFFKRCVLMNKNAIMSHNRWRIKILNSCAKLITVKRQGRVLLICVSGRTSDRTKINF